jgi:hypothetical protein
MARPSAWSYHARREQPGSRSQSQHRKVGSGWSRAGVVEGDPQVWVSTSFALDSSVVRTKESDAHQASFTFLVLVGSVLPTRSSSELFLSFFADRTSSPKRAFSLFPTTVCQLGLNCYALACDLSSPPTQERIIAYVVPAINLCLSHQLANPYRGPQIVIITTTVDQATQASKLFVLSPSSSLLFCEWKIMTVLSSFLAFVTSPHLSVSARRSAPVRSRPSLERGLGSKSRGCLLLPLSSERLPRLASCSRAERAEGG